MTSLPFSLVDVFSGTPFKGNPLAVVDGRAHPQLTNTQMQLLARQFNLSETTFFFPPTLPGAHYRLRSFLPDGREVFGAGHNILGVWRYLAHEGILNLNQDLGIIKSNLKKEFIFKQELGGEVIPLRIKTDSQKIQVMIRQARPQSHGAVIDADHLSALAESMGLAAEDIGLSLGSAKRLPPQVMSTSTTHHLLVPVLSVEALNRVVVQRDKLLEQLRRVDHRAYGLFLFTPDVESGDDGVQTFQARFFSPGMSGEDPATGSAAGPLSAYLYKHGVLNMEKGKGEITVMQGLRVGRSCRIHVELSVDREEFDVDIIGDGVLVGRGDITIPGLDTAF